MLASYGYTACPKGTTYITVDGAAMVAPGQANPCIEPCVRYYSTTVTVFYRLQPLHKAQWQPVTSSSCVKAGAQQNPVVGVSV
jgi:hypothetical protein